MQARLPAHALGGVFFTATSMIGFIALAGIIVRNSIPRKLIYLRHRRSAWCENRPTFGVDATFGAKTGLPLASM